MTKLNLSALKKKADILAHPPSEATRDSQMNSASTVLQDMSQASAASSSSTSHLWTSSGSPTVTESPAVKEFFPNLTVSDELFDDIFAKKETVSVEETPQVYETQSIITETPTSEVAASLESVLPVIEDPVTEAVAPEAIVEDIPSVDWLTPEAVAVLDDTVAPIDSADLIDQTDHVKWVAEGLSLEREGGLTRLSSGKKTAIFALAGLCVVWIIGGGLYTLGVFPPTKTSSIEAVAPVVSNTPTPVVVAVQTGALANTGAVASTGSTLSPELSGTGVTTTLTGATLSGTTLSGTVLTGSTLTWATLSGTVITAGALTGATLSGATLSGSTSSGVAIVKPIPPVTPTGTMTGATNTIRTPNIRLPRTSTGTLR
jgi:Pentapeptide repeats (8 copies)